MVKSNNELQFLSFLLFEFKVNIDNIILNPN